MAWSELELCNMGAFPWFFIIIERLNIIKVPTRFYVIGNIYTLLIVMIGWVLFRSENLEYAVGFILKMFSFTPGNNNYPYIFLRSEERRVGKECRCRLWR